MVNAPLLWFRELAKAVSDLGFIAAPFDPCCFILPNEQGQARGFIGIHVDDGLFAGNEFFHKQINKLESQFPFGSRKKKDFVFIGLQIHQKEDFSITVDQTQYVKDINPIQIDKERKSYPEEPVNETERQAFRGLIGSLQYASVNTRPDLGSRLSLLQGRINNGQIQDLIEGNRLLHDAKVNSNVKCQVSIHPKRGSKIGSIFRRFICFGKEPLLPSRVNDTHRAQDDRRKQIKCGESHRVVFKENSKGGSQHIVRRSNGLSRSKGPSRMVQVVLELAHGPKLPMETR